MNKLLKISRIPKITQLLEEYFNKDILNNSINVSIIFYKNKEF